MYNKSNTPIIFFFIILLVFYPFGIKASDTSRILETDHFIIKTELNYTGYTSVLADKIENLHNLASDFIGYESPEKINVTVSTGDNYSHGFPDRIWNNDYLTVSVDENFNNSCSVIYRKIFTLYLEKSMNNTSPSSVLGDTFCDAIIRYSAADHKYILAVIYDLVNNMGIQQISLRDILKYGKPQNEGIYTASIDYILTSLGKKVFIQSLRDASYYGDLYASVSMISGITSEDLDKGFNIYLAGFKTGILDNRLNNKIFYENDDRYNNISFSISKDIAAVLQVYNEQYRINLKRDKHQGVIPLKHSEHGTVFDNIIFINDNLVCVSEIAHNGSILNVIDINTGSVVKRFSFPYLYLLSASPHGKDRVLFSALCGMYCDVYYIDIHTGHITTITHSGNFSSPVAIKGRLYCISLSDKYNIIELDEKTGKGKSMFSTGQKISDLSIMDENALIFTMDINGITNIYRIDLDGENLVQVTNDNYINRLPRSASRKIYYFSYYKSKYHIFSTGKENLE